MRHFYKPRHAADYNARAARAATELAEVYQPKRAAPEQPEYQPRRVTPGGMNRNDVRLLPLTGPQSPGEAW